MSHEPGGERITEELGIIQGPCRTAGPFDSRPGITFPFALSVAGWRTVVRDSHVAEGLADGWGRGLAPQRSTLDYAELRRCPILLRSGRTGY